MLVFNTSANTKFNPWIVINTSLVDKNNLTLRVFYLNSPSLKVKKEARRLYQEGVKIFLPISMLQNHGGKAVRIDFDLVKSQYKIFEQSEEKVAVTGVLSRSI